MVGIDDFRRALDPHWQGAAELATVRESSHAGHVFRQLSDGSVVVEDGKRRTTSLPNGITIHETRNGLQVNHANGIVVQIEKGELQVGDGLDFKSYGHLTGLRSDNGTYVYESKLEDASTFKIIISQSGVSVDPT